MNNPLSATTDNRFRIGWWLFVLALGVIAAFIAYSFVGMLVLGIFGYYATRPIYRRLGSLTDSDGVVAGLTLVVVLLPVILLAFYAGIHLVQQAQQLLGSTSGVPIPGNVLDALSNQQRRTLLSTVRNPRRFVTNPGKLLQTGIKVASSLIGGILLVGLSLTLSYFLLKNDDDIEDGLTRLFGGRETTAHAYATAVDEDLESVFFGNFLFVIAMSLIAVVTYSATNLFAPGPLHVPMVFVLGLLTGVASLIPIVVGKLIYLPVVGYLGFQAMNSGGNHLGFVGAVLVVYFLVLDILPQTFVQPYMTGRQLDMIVMMFAYLLGPVLFGWYGFFLLPILFILMLEAIRIVLPQLLHGEPLTPTVSMGGSIGTNPDTVNKNASPDDDNTATSDNDD
ncbi:AI-2E family transporter [Haladaptatus caseinilyticus]|uniref:AI-2E family transporter n=1 Tax=Haladaptatus caseinilyticus TaxID=2993314 RepID=UPI00224A533B|nr:AI-2E family transporter [Haladaptatus caseinilyticus]